MSANAFLASQRISLSLSQVRGTTDAQSSVPAIAWFNQLRRLGLSLPLGLVHDIGLLLSVPRAQLRIGHELALLPAHRGVLERHQTLLRALSEVESVEQIASLRPSDKLVAVLLFKLLGTLGQTLPSHHLATTEIPTEGLPSDTQLLSPVEQQQEAQRHLAFLHELQQHAGTLVLRAELLNAQAVRLLAMYDGSASVLSRISDDRIDLLELLTMFEADDLRDTVRFSLDLLPSVLEAQHISGAQSYPTGGYAGLLSRGSLDALLPSELASDEDLFYARFAQSELLYLGRERQIEAPHPLHYILIDGSPSMRGLRQVFARGLALSLIQKLLRASLPVMIRFFDGRLHQAVRADHAPRKVLPYVLGFRSTRGRSYARVFRDLHKELQTICANRKTRVTLYLLTHAECHIPVPTVTALRKLAHIHAVFVRPSSELHLDYLSQLTKYQVISDEALHSEAVRKKQALDILSRVADTAS
jgi:hypothetical protein